MKHITLIVLIILFHSCDSTVKKQTAPAIYEDVKINNEFEKAELEKINTDDLDQSHRDSLKVVYDTLANKYTQIKLKFSEKKQKLLTLSKYDESAYEIYTDTWYFDSLYNLVYQIQEGSSEGGYWFHHFAYYINDSMQFNYNKFGNEGFEDYSCALFNKHNAEAKSIVYSPHNDDSSKLYFLENLFSFKQYESLKTLALKEDLDSIFSYSYFETEDTEYGLMDVGYTIKIDSLLFKNIW